jgi:AraC-like DNA-binding protein
MTRETAATLPETGCPTLWLWPGQAVYAGPALDLGPHSGSVACLAVGVDDVFTVHGLAVRTALIAPRFRHHLVAHGERMVFCYLDAASTRAQACRSRMAHGTGPLRHGHADEAELVSAGARLDTGTVPHWLDLAGPMSSGTIDERIATATRHLLEQPTVSAAELAAGVSLSASRFLHLFREHTGTSFRRYRLWARMYRVGHTIANRGDLTTAAADAGFTSPSHLSDAFHTMFGLRPSTLLATGLTVHLLADTTNPALPTRH